MGLLGRKGVVALTVAYILQILALGNANKKLMNNKISAIVIGLVLLSSASVASQTVKPAYAPASGVNVGIIGGTGIINGGTIPTLDPAFAAFAFTTIGIPPLGALTCGVVACDTLVLNVASAGMGCTTATLSDPEKAAIVSFMTGGGKLIVYDSECQPAVDYTWLPPALQFTTSNPGALGGAGCGDIIENNTLSSSVPLSATEIDVGTPPAAFPCGVTTDPNATPNGLCPTTDACGDANVMIALGADLCKDIDVTTAAFGNPTGTVHAYSKDVGDAGSGMLIYNGFDIDTAFAGTTPTPSGPGGGPLAKILLHELQQPWNPSGLRCGTPVVGPQVSKGAFTITETGFIKAKLDGPNGVTEETVEANLKISGSYRISSSDGLKINPELDGTLILVNQFGTSAIFEGNLKDIKMKLSKDLKTITINSKLDRVSGSISAVLKFKNPIDFANGIDSKTLDNGNKLLGNAGGTTFDAKNSARGSIAFG